MSGPRKDIRTTFVRTKLAERDRKVSEGKKKVFLSLWFPILPLSFQVDFSSLSIFVHGQNFLGFSFVFS
jgi:hypothetical protein